ncbi:MAG TPA: type II secretion system protein GspC, partial [Anaeromyxobacteraceae bacterium]|nr:type II secretion system protein GspC [Anaeromyxobacteraceae bacterium]
GQKPPAQANLGDVGQPRAEQNCANSAATPTKSGLRAQLVAAVVAEQPSQSFASITDLNSRETRIYGVGDDVQGASLLSVERMRDDGDGLGTGFKIVAIVCNSGRKEFLDFEQAEGSPQAHSPASMRAADAPGDPNEAVKKVSDNRYELPKKFIDDTLHNLNAVATQARIVPSFKNGVANGFKVFSIQPGSLYSNIGVENGDVIQRINGYEMNSPDKALEIYQKLQDAPHISIEIERNGQMIRKEYSITGS